MARLKQRIAWRFAGALGLAGVLAVLLVWANDRRVGRFLDTYRGVNVYDNGLLFFRSYGRHCAANGYYYGQKWQCVEFIKRFYHDAMGHKMPDVMGHVSVCGQDHPPICGLKSPTL